MDNPIGQSPEQVNTSVKSSENNRNLIIGLTAVIVVLLGVIVYLAMSKQANGPELYSDSQGQNQTQEPLNNNQQAESQKEVVDWQVYKLPGTSLQFSYPKTLNFKEADQQRYGNNSVYSFANFEGGGLFMQVETNNPGMGLNMEVTGKKQVQVAGLEASYQTLQHSSEAVPNVNDRQKGIYVQFIKDGNEYAALFRYPASGAGQLPLIDQILATFKFTDQKEAVDWKTYRNKNYGFELQLTDAWQGYVVKVQEVSSNFGAGNLVFCVPTASKVHSSVDCDKGYAKIMVVSVMSEEQWNFSQRQEGPKPGLLGRNANYVFGYSFWQDPPSDLINVNFETGKVIASFRPL